MLITQSLHVIQWQIFKMMVIMLKAILTMMRARESDGKWWSGFWVHTNNINNIEPMLWIDGLHCQTIIATHNVMYECLLACIIVNAHSTQQTGSRLLYSQLDTSGTGWMAGLDNSLVGLCDRAEAMSLGGIGWQGGTVTRPSGHLSLALGSDHAVSASMCV